jgi:hypothetical protein
MIRAWHRSSETSRRLDDCPGVGPALVATVRVLRSGRHFSVGAVNIAAATLFPRYLKENLRYKCNQHKVEGVQINYTSTENYIGDDALELLVLFPTGFGKSNTTSRRTSQPRCGCHVDTIFVRFSDVCLLLGKAAMSQRGPIQSPSQDRLLGFLNATPQVPSIEAHISLIVLGRCANCWFPATGPECLNRIISRPATCRC